MATDTRPHHDVEVVVRRLDQTSVRAALLVTHERQCLDPTGSGWRRCDGHTLDAPAFQLQP